MSILYSKLRLEVPSALDGENAIITSNGGNIRTVEMSSPITDIMLAGMDKYRVQAGYTDESVFLGYGQIKKVKSLVAPTNLENVSWSLIQQLIINGTFGMHYAVGDTKTFQMNNKIYHAEVVAINDGTGDAGQWYPDKTVDFICWELYETQYRYNSTNTNTGGFPSSEIKNTLNNTIYPLLPTDLKEVIIDKSHSYQSGRYSGNSWSSQMTTLATKLWMPTCYEIVGYENVSHKGENATNNKKYTLTSKDKHLKDGSFVNWWVSSPYCINTTSFLNYIRGSIQATDSQGVPICFRIG